MDDGLVSDDGKQTRGHCSTGDQTDDDDPEEVKHVSVGFRAQTDERVDRLEGHGCGETC